MRISTPWHQQLSSDAIMNQQTKLVMTQMQLSSGKKILTPSQDPSGAAKLIDLDHAVKINEQYQNNIAVTRQRLSLEESSLRSAVDIVQKIRELGVQGLNDINNADNRKAIAVEMDALNQQLLGLANTQNANGEFIFSGFKSNLPAFAKSGTPPVYSYQGDNNQRLVQIGPARQVTDGDPGQAAFGVIGSNNIMEGVQKFINDLNANNPQTSSLDALDVGLKNFGNVEASVGARLRALDSQEEQNANYIIDSKTTASQIGDLDYPEALSKFNLQQVSLEAAQQAYSKVKDLLLFKYL